MKADTVRLVERRIMAEPVFACSRCHVVFGQRLSFCPVDGALVVGLEVDPLLGSLVGGRYRVLKRIGSDAMGQVYEVRHSLLERRFAMKVLCGELTTNEHARREFVDRAKALGQVSHPNLASVHDCGTTSAGQPFMILDLAVGVSLAQTLKRRGPLGAQSVRQILAQLVSAIEHMELRGLPTPRITLDGILLSETGEARVLRCESRGARNPQAALYAAGRIAYELLHGRRCSTEDGRRAPLVDAAHESTDPSLAATIRWMLAPNQHDRPTSAAAITASLARRETVRTRRRRRSTWRRLLAMATPSLLPSSAAGPVRRRG